MRHILRVTPRKWILSVLAISIAIANTFWAGIVAAVLAAILVLFVASALFWAAFEQAGSSMNLFAERLTNRVEVSGLFWHFVDLVWMFNAMADVCKAVLSARLGIEGAVPAI